MRWTIISGTNRPNSNTRRVSSFIEGELKKKLGPSDVVNVLDLQELPLEIFSPEAYAQKPSTFKKFQDEISSSDAVISVLPEYNGSFPGVYKLFIDMLSFPDSLLKKPASFVGIADGRFGALRSIEQMQQIFLYRKAFLYPESIYIKEAYKQLEPTGKPKDDFVLQLTDQMLTGFIDFAKKIKAA